LDGLKNRPTSSSVEFGGESEKRQSGPRTCGRAHFHIVWPEFVAVAGIGAVLFTPALLRFRKTLIEAQA
jgi:hypothetical protein